MVGICVKYLVVKLGLVTICVKKIWWLNCVWFALVSSNWLLNWVWLESVPQDSSLFGLAGIRVYDMIVELSLVDIGV